MYALLHGNTYLSILLRGFHRCDNRNLGSESPPKSGTSN